MTVLEFVSLFVPNDAFLQPALDHDPTLLEYAVNKQVLIVTPTSLIAMLRTIAYAWTQAALQDDMKRVYELDRSVKAYNKTVVRWRAGSWSGREGLSSP